MVVKKVALLIFLALSTLSANAQMKESEKLGKAIEYFGGEKYHEALILFQGLAKKYRLNPRFYAYMGVCYYKEQDYPHAAEVLDSIIPHIEPFPPHERGVCYYSCAESHFLLGDYPTALSYYEMTLPVAYDREKGDIYYRMGCCGMMMQSDSIQIENFRLAQTWFEKADIALPSATQNEINEEAAKALVANGVIAVSEGANMPTTPEAIKVFQSAKILYSPGKAANAGGVAVSGLEMSQNSERIRWSREEVDQKLHDIMNDIHSNCVKYGTEPDGYINYVKGANVAGFLKVAKAMMAQGIV